MKKTAGSVGKRVLSFLSRQNISKIEYQKHGTYAKLCKFYRLLFVLKV